MKADPRGAARPQYTIVTYYDDDSDGALKSPMTAAISWASPLDARKTTPITRRKA